MAVLQQVLAVLCTALMWSGGALGQGSFREPSIVRPPGLDRVGLNVVAGVAIVTGGYILIVSGGYLFSYWRAKNR
ncbi:Hypp5269 [Branchiostoma lanceolatum]|uniref:Hypp5269 protein n=1 Tax=Branchiostoma lanceolatum TaxID=7740 RepID=A0A8K0AGK9_BRALA|nr:Hypp5269 [Branchiostoma lanceolatum]